MIRINRNRINSLPSEYILIWCIAQSNMGRAGFVFPEYITTEEVMTDVEFWDVHTEEWEDLIPGVNGSPLGNPTQYGFTHELGYRLKLKYPDKKIRFFLAARGGATIGRRGAIPNFFHTGAYPDLLDPENEENWWSRIKNQYAAALAGMSYIDLGALWIQGESNCIEGFPEMVDPYQVWEKNLVQEFQDLTGRKQFVCINVPHPDITNDEMWDSNPEYVTAVRNAHIANNSLGYFSHYRDTTDVNLKEDNVHLDAAAVQTISAWLMENVY